MKRHRIVLAAAAAAAIVLSFVPVSDGAGFPYGVGGILPEAAQLPGEWHPAERLSGLNGLESTVEFQFADEPLARVFRELGASSGFDVYFMSTSDFTRRVSVAVSGRTLRQALALLSASANLEYNVVDATTLIVRVVQEEPIPAEEVLEAVVSWRQTEVPVREVRKRPPTSERRIGEPAQAGARESVTVTAPGPYRVGRDIPEPQRIHYVAPEYPQLARRARMEGFVILQAVIDRQGNVKDVEVLRGLGLGLDEAARDAVMQWKYTPTVHDGELVEVILTVNVVFQLIQ